MRKSREEIISFDKPLKFDDMKDMIGEPVWHSTLEKWMLVEKVFDGYVRMKSVNDVYLYHDYGPDDFETTPMYRMKPVTLIDKLKEVRGEK